MSPSVGAGKTSWSTCSVREFNGFVQQLGTSLQPDNCLTDGLVTPPVLRFDRGALPGQMYNLDQQCRIFHGTCWTHELRDNQDLSVSACSINCK
jgi:hypothetical protein